MAFAAALFSTIAAPALQCGFISMTEGRHCRPWWSCPMRVRVCWSMPVKIGHTPFCGEPCREWHKRVFDSLKADLGSEHLDLLWITHQHSDHLGGTQTSSRRSSRRSTQTMGVMRTGS